MSAASPGVISLFFRNEHYKGHETYLSALADTMRRSTRRSPRPDSCCSRLSRPRHGPAHPLRRPRSSSSARAHAHRGAQPGGRQHPARAVRMHLCWGNYEGPHHRDIPFTDIVDIVFSARPSAISFEAANPRHDHEWTLFETGSCPTARCSFPGVIESKSNTSSTRSWSRSASAATPARRPRERHGRLRLRLRHLGRPAAVDPEVVWAKFAAMAEGARIASRELWR